MYYLERQVGERVVVKISDVDDRPDFDSGMRSINAFNKNVFNNDPFLFYETPTVLVLMLNQADDLRDVREVLPEGKTKVLTIWPCE